MGNSTSTQGVWSFGSLGVVIFFFFFLVGGGGTFFFLDPAFFALEPVDFFFLGKDCFLFLEDVVVDGVNVEGDDNDDPLDSVDNEEEEDTAEEFDDKEEIAEL